MVLDLALSGVKGLNMKTQKKLVDIRLPVSYDPAGGHDHGKQMSCFNLEFSRAFVIYHYHDSKI